MMIGLHGIGKPRRRGNWRAISKARAIARFLQPPTFTRPAAIKQLEVLGQQLDIPVFQLGDKTSPVNIAKGAVKQAKDSDNDLLIIDTAGRLHIDEELMDELKQIKDAVSPRKYSWLWIQWWGRTPSKWPIRITRKSASTASFSQSSTATPGAARRFQPGPSPQADQVCRRGRKISCHRAVSPGSHGFKNLGMGDVLSFN